MNTSIHNIPISIGLYESWTDKMFISNYDVGLRISIGSYDGNRSIISFRNNEIESELPNGTKYKWTGTIVS